MSHKSQINPEQVTANIAMTIASMYGLLSEVSDTMSDGYTPYEALYEWDIVDEDLIEELIQDEEEHQRMYLEAMAESIAWIEDDLPF